MMKKLKTKLGQKEVKREQKIKGVRGLK